MYLIWGQRERLLPESSFEFYAAHLPASAWIERPIDFGHTPYLERPAAFIERLRAFLDERATGQAKTGAVP